MERIPDPQSGKSFEASSLRWDEIERAPHSGVLELYRACLCVRNGNPGFRPTGRRFLSVREWPQGAIAIRLFGDSSEWLLLVDLVGGHSGNADALFSDAEPSVWTIILSTREHRFGGDGGCALSPTRDRLHFTKPEALLLKRNLAEDRWQSEKVGR